MRNFETSRTLFQLLAIGLFVYQFQNSIIKYITGPITTQTSTTSFDKIQQPLIYLCQEDQFDYTEARHIGYKTMTHFSMGNLIDSTNYTWNGRYGNISYHEIQDRIYNTDYRNLVVENSKTGVISDFQIADTEMVYFVPLGFCINIMPTKKFTIVKNTEKSELYLVDPAGANKLRMFESNDAKINFGPTDVGYYDRMVFEVEVKIHDFSIHDGKTCMNYEKMGTSYNSCVQNEMKTFLLEWYKCLPPWFPKNSTLTCLKSDVLEINDANLTMLDQFTKFIKKLRMEILQPCLPPCVTMLFKLNKVMHIKNRVDTAIVDINVKDEIKVDTDVYAYDIFNLVVDLGSSLGLWLGLSALNIFDTLVEFYTAMQRKYFH